jgi:hypothetical protein
MPYCDTPMTTTTQNIADELILHKDLVEHQKKIISKQEEMIKNLREQIAFNKYTTEMYKTMAERLEGNFDKLKKIHSDYVAKVNSGLDELMENRIFKI